MMGLGRAIAYILEDKEWLSKLAVVTLFSAFSLVPVVGLIGLAVLLGYLVEIVSNLNQRKTPLLPVWGQFEKYIGDGATILTAVFVYNLPIIMMTSCVIFFPRALAENIFAAGGAALLALCCVVPMILIYTLAAWTMLAVATSRYAITRAPAEYTRLNRLMREVQHNANPTIQWVLLMVFLNIILGLLAVIPIAGWLLVLAFAIPVHAHLLGQYALRLKFITPPQAPSAPQGKAKR